MMEQTMLKIKGLSVSYEERKALQEINLEVPSGKIVCIVGESGAGKSTLLKAITGYRDLTVEAGQIFLGDQEITTRPGAKQNHLLGEAIGVIPQNPAGSFNPIRRYEPQIRETLRSHRMAYERERVIKAFASTGLHHAEEILTQRPYELSGGMNQRVAVAAAMLLEPKLLLCDEPTSALDVNTQDLVMEEFVRINRESGTTILMVTHNLGLAGKIADNIAIMARGKIIEQGEAHAVIRAPKEAYTRKLIDDVPKL